MQRLVPEVVNGVEGDLSKGETLAITYANLIPVLTKSIQEQQVLIEEQRRMVDRQEETIAELQKVVVLHEKAIKKLKEELQGSVTH